MHLPQTLSSSLTFWLRTYLINQYVILQYCSSNLCKWNYLYGDLPFFRIQVNHFMAQDKPFGAKIIPKCILWVRGLVPFWVLRHSFLSLTGCLWLYNIQLKTSRGHSFCPLLMPMSQAFSISFNKTLLHKSSERSSLVSGPRLNSSPSGAKNPGVVIQQPFNSLCSWDLDTLFLFFRLSLLVGFLSFSLYKFYTFLVRIMSRYYYFFLAF